MNHFHRTAGALDVTEPLEKTVWCSFPDDRSWLYLREDNGVDLGIMVDKVDLQAFCDIVGEVGEVLLVLRWEDHARHTCTTSLQDIGDFLINYYSIIIVQHFTLAYGTAQDRAPTSLHI